MQNQIYYLEKKWKKQKKLILDKETEEVMNLVGRSIDEGNSTAMDTSIKNYPPRQMQKEPNHKAKDSHSMQNSTDRGKMFWPSSKLKIVTSKIANSSRQRNKNLKSSKVQMILERHRKLKQNESKYKINQNETMQENLEKIHKLTNNQRRDKNMSNMSAQPNNSNFLNFTLESKSHYQTSHEEVTSVNSNCSEGRFIHKELNNKRYVRNNIYTKDSSLSETSNEESGPTESVKIYQETILKKWYWK